MKVVKILLVLGLGYVALNQKVVKTRNMLLVVTGLLAFCMFSVEGFTVTFNALTGFSDSDQTVSERTITVGSDAATQIVYTLPSSGTTYNSDNSIPSTGYSCTIGGSPGVIGKYTGADAQTSDITDSSTDGPFNISKIFTCEALAADPCPGYTSTNKPPFCECLKKTEGDHYHCNSGWTGEAGSLGKYIAENAAGSGWEFKDDYTDGKVYKCDADMLSGISGGAVELFSGKCFVKKDETYTTQGCLNLCDAPISS